MFFPSLPFMGVMLFPSLWLGNAPGEGGASLALLSLFLILLSLFSSSPLLFSPFSFSFFSIHFSSSPAFHPHLLLFSSFLLFYLPPLSFASFFCFFIFFFKGTACTVCFQDVGDDATYCNPIVIQL